MYLKEYLFSSKKKTVWSHLLSIHNIFFKALYIKNTYTRSECVTSSYGIHT